VVLTIYEISRVNDEKSDLPSFSTIMIRSSCTNLAAIVMASVGLAILLVELKKRLRKEAKKRG